MEKLILNDTNTLSYQTYGNPGGKAIFYFHGFPGSHHEIDLFQGDELAKSMGFRLIAIDRPGYGESDFQKNRKLLDWPDTVSRLADHLNIDKFSVLGCSGGGPYALACAYKIPDRLSHVAVVSGMAPFKAPGMKKGLSASIPKAPGFLQNFIFNNMRKMINNNPEKFINKMRESISLPDKLLMNQEDKKSIFIRIMEEALSNGNRGLKEDAKIYKSDWGFDLNEVEHKIHLWYGEKDKNVKVQSSKYVEEELQNCSARFFKEEGHFSVLINQRTKILKQFI